MCPITIMYSCKCYSSNKYIFLNLYYFKHSTEEYIKCVESKECIKFGGNADLYFVLFIGN